MKSLLIVALLLGSASAWAASSQQCFPEITCRVTAPPKTQVLTAAQTIVANACGSVKPISAASAITTSTIDTFDDPNGGNAGCIMAVCNVGAFNITLDNNVRFKSAGGADVVVTPDDCVFVGNRGDAVWTQLSALLAN